MAAAAWKGSAKEAIRSYLAAVVTDGELIPIEEPALVPVVVEVDAPTGTSELAPTG